MSEEQNNSIVERIGKWYKKTVVGKIVVVMFVVVSMAIPAGVLYFYIFQPQIVVEPQKLGVSLSPGENFTKTFSIGAIGRGVTEVRLVATEPIDKWVNLSNKSIKNKSVKESIERGKTSYINVSFENIPPDVTPGEYRGAILIWDNDKVKAEIPVFIKIHKTMVQIVGIKAPLKVNESEYFKITAEIKNIGDSDAFEVNASASSTTNDTRLTLAEEKLKFKDIPIIHKNETVSADWWFKTIKTEANETSDWAIITVNLGPKNDSFDTEIIAVEIV